MSTKNKLTTSFSKRVVCAIALIALSFTYQNCSGQEIQWYPDLASAKQAATSQNKLLLMHFSAKWCRPCKTLETFVFSSPNIQRGFAENVIAVKLDVDQNTDLVQEYGVTSVPYDVAVTTSGRVVSKRKSPKDASAYSEMLTGLGRITNDLANGDSPALVQNLGELQELMQNQNPKFEGQPTSFTPDSPTHQLPGPSRESAELNRNLKVISNPFTKAQKANRIAHAITPSQNATSQKSPTEKQNVTGRVIAAVPAPVKPQQVTNNQFDPNEFGGDFQVSNSGFVPPAAETDFVPQPPREFIAESQSTPAKKIAIQSLEQTEAESATMRENTGLKTIELQPQSEMVMDNQFNIKTPAQPKQQMAKNPGDYRAKISVPNNDDFAPPKPPATPVASGDVQAKIVVGADNEFDSGHFQRPRTKAMPASASHNDSKLLAPIDPISAGLEMASQTPAQPKYALHGKCPVTLLAETKWVDGDPQWGCVHRNRIYIFSSAENLRTFQQDPDANSPILAGYDPVLFLETGKLVDGLEKHGVFMGKTPNQRIVLFANAQTRSEFQSAPRKYLDVVRQAMSSAGGSSSQILR